MRFPLIGGSYVARSLIANAQRCINYFPEINRGDSPVPYTYYQRPGLRPLVTGPQALPVRMLYRASNGNGYAVIGQKVFSIDASWAITELGTLAYSAGTPCRAIDNGDTILLVDNSPLGYTIDLATNAFAQVVDPSGIFNGATMVAYLDTYTLWNLPNSRLFGSTLSNLIEFDALYVAGKVGYPDKLVGVYVNRHEVLLFGTLKSEIWYNAGNPTFPFAILPGAYIEHGCVAPFSIAAIDIETFWLGQDLSGNGVVFGLKGYDTRRISNHALEVAIQKMPTISDAIAYTYQQGGHYFYVLTFPSGNQTWVYDTSFDADPTMAWHQECWTDGNGNLNRTRGMCGAFINGENVVGDHHTGTIYSMDSTYYKDTVGGEDFPITYIKGFPHLFQAPGSRGELVASDNKRIQYRQFTADIEVGMAPLNSDGSPPRIGFRWSIDRGVTYGTTILQTIGNPGEFVTSPNWAPLGIARDIVFELEHSIAGPAALNGCWVEAELLAT